MLGEGRGAVSPGAIIQRAIFLGGTCPKTVLHLWVFLFHTMFCFLVILFGKSSMPEIILLNLLFLASAVTGCVSISSY